MVQLMCEQKVIERKAEYQRTRNKQMVLQQFVGGSSDP